METMREVSVDEATTGLAALIEGLDGVGEPVRITVQHGTHGVLLSETMYDALSARIKNLEDSLSADQAHHEDAPTQPA